MVAAVRRIRGVLIRRVDPRVKQGQPRLKRLQNVRQVQPELVGMFRKEVQCQDIIKVRKRAARRSNG